MLYITSVLSFFLLIINPINDASVTPVSAETNKDHLAEISTLDSIVNVHINDHDFSGVVLLADQGKVVYTKASHQRSQDQISTKTHFSIASITKMLTAIVILQLEEEGKLSVQDTLSRWLPEFPIPSAENITIHHLLLHISGLPNEPDDIFLRPVSPADFIRATLQNGKIKEPGHFNYANIDYVLLGLIIEKATGQFWEEVIRERIINKLGLENTGFLAKGNYPEDFAYSYTLTKRGKEISDPLFHIENFFAAGCMYSNVYDLLKVDQAMYDDHFLSRQSKENMFTSYPEYNYTGYSVWTYRYLYAKTQPLVMERRGGILGANVVIMRLLDDNRTIIILSNNDRFQPDSFGDMNNLREALIMTWAG